MTEDKDRRGKRNAHIALVIALIPIALFVATFFIKRS